MGSDRSTRGWQTALWALLCVFVCSIASPLAVAQDDEPPDPVVLEQQARVRELKQALRRITRPDDIPRGTMTSIAYLLEMSDHLAAIQPAASREWADRAERYTAVVRDGRDPLMEERGKIANRGYHSGLSTLLQGYAVYVPPDYDPSKSYPLYLTLHGGSSNGNLFLGVMLGHNLSWTEYRRHLYDRFEPRVHPKAIIVAPDGFGQVMWRWMGERDVFDVLEDVKAHYNIDDSRITLSGLSNGGVGTYAIGMRHASRFAAVQAMAGAPSWTQYVGRMRPEELRAIKPLAGLSLAENTFNTDFRYYHGERDSGPMRPQFVREFSNRLRRLDLPRNEYWLDAGHDILNYVTSHGRSIDQISEWRRDPRPSEVRLVTGDYRAARQHWLSVTRIANYPNRAQLRATVRDQTVTITTSDAAAFAIHIREVPLAAGPNVIIVVDEREVYVGPRAPLGDTIHLRRGDTGFELGFPNDPPGFVKKLGSSGPLTDAYFEPTVHVYGTLDSSARGELREAAVKGANGWPRWLWRFEQQVLADNAVTEDVMRNNNLVLYVSPGSNSIYERIKDQLPITADERGLHVGSRTFLDENPRERRDFGARYIFPNPLAPGRYVTLQIGTTARAVTRGHNLPDFLPDYLVFDRRTTRSRERLTTRDNRPLLLGFFDDQWRLPAELRPSEAASHAPRTMAPAAPAMAPTAPATMAPAAPAMAPTAPATMAPAAPATMAAPTAPATAPTAPATMAAPVRPTPMRDPSAPAPDPTLRAPAPDPTLRAPAPDPSATRAADGHDHGGALHNGDLPGHLSEGGQPTVRGVRPSTLPVADAPPVPPRPAEYPAGPRDQAGVAAREISRRVQTFVNYRATIPGAQWAIDEESAWRVRPRAECMAELRERGIRARWRPRQSTPVPSPVELVGPVDGVWFRSIHHDRPILISCELATRLPRLVEILKRHGVHGVNVMSSHRVRPRTSFHTMGLALDMSSFWMGDRWLNVFRDYEVTPDQYTCEGDPPEDEDAAKLRALACDLIQSHLLSSVLTPNYNEGHADHFHVDIRPADTRFFSR